MKLGSQNIILKLIVNLLLPNNTSLLKTQNIKRNNKKGVADNDIKEYSVPFKRSMT